LGRDAVVGKETWNGDDPNDRLRILRSRHVGLLNV